MNPPVCQRDFQDADLRGHGCTLASLAYLAGEMTDGKAWRDPETYVARLRVLSGVPIATFRDRGTTLTEGRDAYLKAPGFDGRQAPRMRLMRGVKVREELLPALGGGRLAIVAAKYGVIQDAGKGVGSFRDGHAVVVGPRDGDTVPVADPLRRSITRWKVDLLVRAMETFGKRPWGDGRGEAAIAYPSATLLEVRTIERDKARRELAIAVAKVKQLDHRVAELEGLPQGDCVKAVNAERMRVLDLLSGRFDEMVAEIR